VDAYNTFGEITYLNKAEEVFRFIKKNSLDKDPLYTPIKRGVRRVDWIFGRLFQFWPMLVLKLYGSNMTVYLILDFAQKHGIKLQKQICYENSGITVHRIMN